MDLTTPVRYLKGAGPRRAELLARLGIASIGDLLEHYPRAYLDRSTITAIARLRPGSDATIAGVLRAVELRRTRSGLRNVHAIVEDDSGSIECIWFNQPYLTRALKRGQHLVLSGRVDVFRRMQMKNPEFERIEQEERHLAPGIIPVYRSTAGLSQKVLRMLVRRALDDLGPQLNEFMPQEVLRRCDLMEWAEALEQIHFPRSKEDLESARRRIGFQELFDLQVLLAASRRSTEQPGTAVPIRAEGKLVARLFEALSFKPTGAQTRAIEEIRADLARPFPMHRLLEGDVGSGKTLVALAACLLAVEEGWQSAFMVPTEILAVQHASNFEATCKRLGVRVGLLVGSLPARKAQAVREAIARGEVDLAVGTHALIQESVAFSRLGMVVVDEQHRFGVMQRARLLGKGSSPHTLIMSATPIPRTLALAVYGDLDISVLDEKPPGREAPKTHLVPTERYEEMLSFIAEQLSHGAQAFFVCPLIEASEKSDLAAAEALYERLTRHPVMGRFPAGLLHGRMRAEEKQRVMADFAEGRLKFIVSTTVVEVGVDVPNANIMVVEHPERYGLSQLHQLRGRVGRGRKPAYVFLIQGPDLGVDAKRRLEILVREDDGFRIAEEDLRQRGPGDFFGTKQSGLPPLKVADPIREPGLLKMAAEEANRFSSLGDPKATPVWERLLRNFGERIRLYSVG